MVVRKVCGIGLCNQYTPPSMFTACMAIAACEFCYSLTSASIPIIIHYLFPCTVPSMCAKLASPVADHVVRG